MSLANNLHEYSFFAAAVELVVENVLPRPQMKFAVRDRHHHLTAHDLPLVVGIRIIFAGPIVVVPFRRRIERGQFFQPLVVVVVQASFIIVDEDARGDVHCIYKCESVLNATFSNKSFYVLVDRDYCSTLRDVHPQFFCQCFHAVNLLIDGGGHKESSAGTIIQ